MFEASPAPGCATIGTSETCVLPSRCRFRAPRRRSRSDYGRLWPWQVALVFDITLHPVMLANGPCRS